MDLVDGEWLLRLRNLVWNLSPADHWWGGINPCEPPISLFVKGLKLMLHLEQR